MIHMKESEKFGTFFGIRNHEIQKRSVLVLPSVTWKSTSVSAWIQIIEQIWDEIVFINDSRETDLQGPKQMVGVWK